jgi:hypothetical protein
VEANCGVPKTSSIPSTNIIAGGSGRIKSDHDETCNKTIVSYKQGDDDLAKKNGL